jgi:predicted amidohydrolase YtcJ
MYVMWSGRLMDHIDGLGIYSGYGNNMLKLGSAKLMMDGSLGARTAALFEPYADDPTTTGLLSSPKDEFKATVKKIHNMGNQIATHAIGDRTIEVTINAYEEAMKANPRKDHRHRIEHCEVLTTTQIERIKELGIIPSVQPNFVGEWSGPDGLYEARLGKKRLQENNPYRTLLDNDITICSGSDGMPFHPLYGIWSAVNHWIKDSRITLEEAVRSFTLDAAYASFEETLKGSIETGKLADITIIEEDLTEIPSDDIKDATIHMTIVGGNILYYNK